MNSPLLRFDSPFRRHRLVRVLPAAWDALLASRPDLADEPLLRDWANNHWPLIVRRPMPGEEAGLALGLPLPPSAGKRRIALQCQPGDIASVMPLPGLAEVFGTPPESWLPSLRELLLLAAKYEVTTGVFGSLAWQWLTGLTYLSPGSDIDLAWDLPRHDRVDRFLDELADLDARAPMRLDGELVRADGAGINWRELHAGDAELALKTATDVVLYPRKSFIGAPA
jgi:phosphoribosyl-dephospho-CoA transferase